MTTIHVDDRQLATMLAALRYWQRIAPSISMAEDEHAIASDGGAFECLQGDEVDTLCERINLPETSPPLLIAVVLEGGMVQDVVWHGGVPGAALGFDIAVIDYDTDGAGTEDLFDLGQGDALVHWPAVTAMSTTIADGLRLHSELIA